LTLGLHHNLPEGYPISAVEREHRIRVFWSIYITDRITGSKLGHPLSVRDSDIDVDIPSMEGLTANDQEEFADPAHIVAHLKLARITGEIISDIYGRSSQQDRAFVYSVQKILRNLRSWAETLPENVRLSSTSPYRYSSRNVASLHLCFNQVHQFRFPFESTLSNAPTVCHPYHSSSAVSCLQVVFPTTSYVKQRG
jgi:proline utilization trans-activator